MTSPINPAVEEYLRREKIAMKTQAGANHKAIIAAVAGEFDMDAGDLAEKVIEFSVARAC